MFTSFPQAANESKTHDFMIGKRTSLSCLINMVAFLCLLHQAPPTSLPPAASLATSDSWLPLLKCNTHTSGEGRRELMSNAWLLRVQSCYPQFRSLLACCSVHVLVCFYSLDCALVACFLFMYSVLKEPRMPSWTLVIIKCGTLNAFLVDNSSIYVGRLSICFAANLAKYAAGSAEWNKYA